MPNLSLPSTHPRSLEYDSISPTKQSLLFCIQNTCSFQNANTEKQYPIQAILYEAYSHYYIYAILYLNILLHIYDDVESNKTSTVVILAIVVAEFKVINIKFKSMNINYESNKLASC